MWVGKFIFSWIFYFFHGSILKILSFPTHLSGHTLVLILVPAGFEYVKHVEALPIDSDMSDHALILFSLEVMRPHAVRKTITFRSYRNVDNNSIVNESNIF